MGEQNSPSLDAAGELALEERAWPSTDCFGMDTLAACLTCTTVPVTGIGAASAEAEERHCIDFGDSSHIDYCRWRQCD